MENNELLILNLNTYIEFLQAQVSERDETIRRQTDVIEAQEELLESQTELLQATESLLEGYKNLVWGKEQEDKYDSEHPADCTCSPCMHDGEVCQHHTASHDAHVGKCGLWISCAECAPAIEESMDRSWDNLTSSGGWAF